MALIVCPECKKEVSDTCKTCIHCGYTLPLSHVSQTVYYKKETTTNFASLKKSKKLIVIPIIAAVVAFFMLAITVIGAVLIFAFSNKRDDPFDKLYNDQTRISVREAYGRPDMAKNEKPTEEYSWNIDTYYNVEFLGNEGEFSVWYDDNNRVTHAWFNYNYPVSFLSPDKSPSDKDRDNARQYALDIIEYYTKKYGSPEKDYYDFEWTLSDGSKICMNYDLYPGEYDDVIVLFWD